MRVAFKKVIMSIITVLFILLTMVSTTYAWIGIMTYSSTEKIDINLKVEDTKKDYFLTISPTGKVGTFNDFIDKSEIQKQILVNRYDDIRYIDFENAKPEEIDSYFNKKSLLSPITGYVDNSNYLNFGELDLDKASPRYKSTKSYFEFDLYLTVDSKEGIQSNTKINSNIFLTDLNKTLIGVKSEGVFIDGNPFIEEPSNPLYDILKTVPEKFNVDSSNAARIGFQLYNPIDINLEYDNTEKPYKTIIYQGGKENPHYDSIENIYDLGGNLPEDYNTAIKEINKIKYGYNLTTPLEITERGDLELKKENSNIFKAPKEPTGRNYLGIENGIQTKIKIKVFFWIEGFDADCLKNIDSKSISLNLTFTADMDELNS